VLGTLDVFIVYAEVFVVVAALPKRHEEIGGTQQDRSDRDITGGVVLGTAARIFGRDSMPFASID